MLLVVQWLPSKEMGAATRLQNLNEAIYILSSVNTRWKGMNTIVGKY